MRGSPRPRADYPETPCRLQQGLQVEIGTPFGTGRILTLHFSPVWSYGGRAGFQPRRKAAL